MTETEYLEKLKQIEEDYNYKIKVLRNNYMTSNAQYSVGMDITDGNQTIRITRITYTTISGKVPEVLYEGVILTKKFEPNKKGETYFINQSQPKVHAVALPLKA